MSDRQITRNRARCKKCSDTVESRSRHDHRYCKCGQMFVDGGTDYLRRGHGAEGYVELSEYQDDAPQIITDPASPSTFDAGAIFDSLTSSTFDSTPDTSSTDYSTPDTSTSSDFDFGGGGGFDGGGAGRDF